MVQLHGPSVSRIFNFKNVNGFIAHAYKSAIKVLQSGKQVCIKT